MKKIIYVNKNNIISNYNGSTSPVITVRIQNDEIFCDNLIIKKDNIEVARVVYSPSTPIGSGAHVWIETENEIEIL